MTNRATEYTAKFYYPGSLIAETAEVAINSADPRKVEFPTRAYAFEIFVVEVVTDGGDKFYSVKQPLDGITYWHPDSTFETLAEVEQREPFSTLTMNMKDGNWDRIVWNRWGSSCSPFDDNTVILERTK